MSNIIIQPVGKKEAVEHFNQTTIDKVEFSTIKSLLEHDELENVKKYLDKDNKVAIWSVKNSVGNQRQFDKMKINDQIMFGTKQEYHTIATIKYLFTNPKLGYFLYGDCGEKQHTNILILENVKSINLDYLVFNVELCYKDKFSPQGVTVLDDTKSLIFYEKFNKILA